MMTYYSFEPPIVLLECLNGCRKAKRSSITRFIIFFFFSFPHLSLRMDPRRKLAALDPDLESPFEPAPSISSNKIARFQGKSSSLTSSTSSNSTGQHQSRAKLEQEEKDRKERLEKEEQEKAYKEFLQDFGGGDDDDDQPSTSNRSTGGSGNRRGGSRSSLGVGKGFVRAGGEERYNPLAQAPPQPPSTTATTTNIPTGPKALTSTMLEKAQPPPPSGPRAMVGSTGGGFGKIGRKNALNFDDDEDQVYIPVHFCSRT